ncbi:MAG: polymer-forming cytoskeletal protein [Pseudomonadota bacterium]
MRAFSLGKPTSDTDTTLEAEPVTPRRPQPSFARTSRPLDRETLICDDIVIRGDLTSKERLVVEGEIEGEVAGSTIEIGERGRVVGAIKAETVTVRGRVEGTITAKTVQLAKTAKVDGDIFHQGIGIEMGTHYDGRLKWTGPRDDLEQTGQKSSTSQTAATPLTSEPVAPRASATIEALKQAAHHNVPASSVTSLGGTDAPDTPPGD